MSLTASFLTSVLLLVMVTVRGFGGQDVSAYLTEKDGRKALKEPLSLREVQTGIAGRTATVCAPKKLLYQTVRRPIRSGKFFSGGAVRKCSSIAWNPPSMARKLSGPIAIIVERPMALSME